MCPRSFISMFEYVYIYMFTFHSYTYNFFLYVLCIHIFDRDDGMNIHHQLQLMLLWVKHPVSKKV